MARGPSPLSIVLIGLVIVVVAAVVVAVATRPSILRTAAADPSSSIPAPAAPFEAPPAPTRSARSTEAPTPGSTAVPAPAPTATQAVVVTPAPAAPLTPSQRPTAAPTTRPSTAPPLVLSPADAGRGLPLGDDGPARPTLGPPLMTAAPSGASPSPSAAAPSASAASPSPAPSEALPSPPAGSPEPAPTSREPEQLSGYDWPLYHGRMTSFFGPREGGFLVVDGQRIHTGLDTTTWCGDKVKAAHKGVVLAAGRRYAQVAGFQGSLGDFYERMERRDSMRLLPIVVVIDDGNGYRSMYVHLSKALVKVGQKVRKGQVIGLEGATGNATGCHVHYELIRMDGPWMRVANDMVREYHYPRWQRERVDPLRVLRMNQKRAGRYVPGIERPRLPPSLRAPGKED